MVSIVISIVCRVPHGSGASATVRLDSYGLDRYGLYRYGHCLPGSAPQRGGRHCRASSSPLCSHRQSIGRSSAAPIITVGHNYIGYNYMGHDYIGTASMTTLGHDYTGHNYIAHDHIGHNYTGTTSITIVSFSKPPGTPRGMGTGIAIWTTRQSADPFFCS